MDRQGLKRKIQRHNEKVGYNRSITSWIVDIIACLAFFPMFIMEVYRRGKYYKYREDFQ